MMVQKKYSVDFFNSAVENLQRACQTLISFNHVVELSGYLALEIDNVKKERFVLSEFVQSNGNVISESFCTKAWRTGVTVQRQHQLRGGNNAPHPTSSVYGNILHPYDNESRVSQGAQQNRTGCTQIRKNPVKQEPSHSGNKVISSTFVNSQHGQGKQAFGCNPPMQNPIKKLLQRPQVGPSGQKDNTLHLQNVQSSMKLNHQVEQCRSVVKTETDFHMGPSQTGDSHSGTTGNSFGQGKRSCSRRLNMMPPMQQPPARLNSEILPRRQFCNPQGRGGNQKNIQKPQGQEALPVKAGPKLVTVSSGQTQPAKHIIASMPEEVTKENLPQDKAATSKADTEVSSALLLGEHGTITNAPEKFQVSKPEPSSFAIAAVCPVLSKVPTIPKCITSHSDDKAMPRLEQMEPLLRPLSPIVVINSLSSSLYKQARVTVMSARSTNTLSGTGPAFSTADIELEMPLSTPAITCAEPDDDTTYLHGALPASVNPSLVTAMTSLPQPNIETKPVTSGQWEQGPNSSGFKLTLEELCLGPPAKHPKLTGKKTKEKAVKKQTKKGRRKSSQPRKADYGEEDVERLLPVLIGPTNRTLRSAANPVRRYYAEDQECENDTEITDTNTNTEHM